MGHSAMGASQFGSDVVRGCPTRSNRRLWTRCQVKSRREADNRLRPRLIQSEHGRLAATQLILAMVRRQSSANTYFMIFYDSLFCDACFFQSSICAIFLSKSKYIV